MLAATAFALALPAADASAGFFDFLFGGGSRRSAPPPAPPMAKTDQFGNIIEGGRSESGPSVAYCVRLCDGHPFPVQSGDASAAKTCSSMCPAAQTKVFNGSSIDQAVASDGKRYSSLPTAFVYRKQLVADCTCNGRSPGGLVRVDAKSDPTLQAGDIVATNEGLMSYRGGGSKAADFTPVKDRKLSAIHIRPAPVSAASAAALSARAQEAAPPDADEPKPKKSKRRAYERDRDRDRDYR
jgi:hypothetical protein